MTDHPDQCERCGERFTCEAGSDRCWCNAVAPLPASLAGELAAAYRACLCPACLRELAAHGSLAPRPGATEG